MGRAGAANLYQEYGYTLNENGALGSHGAMAEDYLADVLASKAGDVHQPAADDAVLPLSRPDRAAPAGQPRRPARATPSPAPSPRGPPSFNQEDVSREPQWLRSRPLADQESDPARSTSATATGCGPCSAWTTWSARWSRTLRATGKLDNTYIFFTSDNGFHLGQHRLAQGKTTPFDESIKVPLVVRGPGIRGTVASRRDGRHAWTSRPTFAALGGAVLAALRGGPVPAAGAARPEPPVWRQNVLIEFDRPTNRTSARRRRSPPTGPAHAAHTYVSYATGEDQLYDLRQGPLPAPQPRRDRLPGRCSTDLRARLEAMRTCVRSRLPGRPTPPVSRRRPGTATG